MTDAPWYTTRGVVASGALLAVLALIGVALAFTGAERDSTSRTAHAVRPVDTAGSVCGLPAGSQDPVVGPPEARWRLVGWFATPEAADVGPGITGPRTRRCFAHSPEGALFAAVSFLAVAGRYPDDAAAMERITARTRARDVYLRQPSEPLDPAIRMQVAGFRMRVVDRDNVTVDVVMQSNLRGALVSMVLPMRWEQRAADGDWRLVIPSLQQPYIARRVADLRGYVRWAGA